MYENNAAYDIIRRAVTVIYTGIVPLCRNTLGHITRERPLRGFRLREIYYAYVLIIHLFEYSQRA